MKQKLLAILCALFTVQMAAWAEEKSGYCGVSTVNDGMDVKWVLSEDSVLTISGTGEMKDYSLVNMPWRDYRQGIREVVIEQGVTGIGSNAFRSCTALTTATIPNSVTRLGRNCFMACNVVNATIDMTIIGDSYDENGELIQDFSNSNLQNHLRNLTIGRSVEGFSLSIVRRLDSVVVDEGNPLYDSRENCNAIISTATNELIVGKENTMIPNSVTSIGGDAFSGCTGLTEIVIPDSVRSIGSGAFKGCTNLAELTIGSSVREISSAAFNECQSLSVVTCLNPVPPTLYAEAFPFSTTTILRVPDALVYQNSDWTNYFMSFNFEEIENTELVNSGYCGDPAVNGGMDVTWSLSEDSVLTISGTGTMADYYRPWRYRVKKVIVEEGVTSIGDGAFYGCAKLVSAIMPNSVTSIGADAFSQCFVLADVVIPASVDEIGMRAFHSCMALTGITIPASVTKIEDATFAYCSGLEEVTIPNSVEIIGGMAFYHSVLLKEVTIGSSVTSIGTRAFADCHLLSTVTSLNPVPPTLRQDVFSVNSETAILRVPDVEAYKASDWAQYFNAITSVETVGFMGYCGDPAVNDGKDVTWHFVDGKLTISGAGAIAGYYEWDFAQEITEVVINEGVTEIGNYVFSVFDSLTSITIPASVTSIGDGVLYYCPALASIVVEEGNTVYDSRDNCNAIIRTAHDALIVGCQNTVIPNTVWRIQDKAFSDCHALTEIAIPNSVREIGSQAFFRCSGLLRIVIPNSVTSIYNQVFQGCESLKEVTIPSSVTSIGDWAFSGCNSLSLVTCLNPVPPTLRQDVFSVNSETAILRVPDVEAYKASDWAKYFSKSRIRQIDLTAIRGIEAGKKNVPTTIHDLSGRRVTAPVKGRIYIVDGKTVVW